MTNFAEYQSIFERFLQIRLVNLTIIFVFLMPKDPRRLQAFIRSFSDQIVGRYLLSYCLYSVYQSLIALLGIDSLIALKMYYFPVQGAVYLLLKFGFGGFQFLPTASQFSFVVFRFRGATF